MNTITVNGLSHKVVNSFSDGPGQVPYRYELRGNVQIERIGQTWWRQNPGQFAEIVTVERA